MNEIDDIFKDAAKSSKGDFKPEFWNEYTSQMAGVGAETGKVAGLLSKLGLKFWVVSLVVTSIATGTIFYFNSGNGVSNEISQVVSEDTIKNDELLIANQNTESKNESDQIENNEETIQNETEILNESTEELTVETTVNSTLELVNNEENQEKIRNSGFRKKLNLVQDNSSSLIIPVGEKRNSRINTDKSIKNVKKESALNFDEIAWKDSQEENIPKKATSPDLEKESKKEEKSEASKAENNKKNEKNINTGKSDNSLINKEVTNKNKVENQGAEITKKEEAEKKNVSSKKTDETPTVEKSKVTDSSKIQKPEVEEFNSDSKSSDTIEVQGSDSLEITQVKNNGVTTQSSVNSFDFGNGKFGLYLSSGITMLNFNYQRSRFVIPILESKKTFGWNIGLDIKYKLKNKFYLNSGFSISAVNLKDHYVIRKIDNSVGGIFYYSVKLEELNFVNIPVGIQYTTTRNDKGVSHSFGLNLNYSFLVRTKRAEFGQLIDSLYPGSFGNHDTWDGNSNKLFNRHSLWAGVNYQYNKNRFGINIEFVKDITGLQGIDNYSLPKRFEYYQLNLTLKYQLQRRRNYRYK